MKRISFTVINDLSCDQRMMRICTSLSNAGYRVTLIGRELKSSVPLISRAYKQVRLKCFFVKGKLFYTEYNIRLFFYLLFNHFEIYCGIDLDTIVANHLVAKLKCKPCVYDAHEYFPGVAEVVGRPVVKMAWTMVEKFIVPRVKYCYTVNQSIAELFKEKYNVDFHIIRNMSVKSDFFDIPKDEKYILYQGDLNIDRGIDETIEAMKYLDCKFYICGMGLQYNELVILSKKNGVENKIKFHGRLKPEDLKEITLKATIGITFFRNTCLNNYYSLANRFFDYMHSGVPQIMVDFPEYKRINTEIPIGILINLSAVNIIGAVNKMFEDKALYNQLKSNCLKAREIYNWQNEEIKLTEIYKSIKS